MSRGATSNLLAAFVAIAQSGSISAAAKRQDIDKSLLSRQLARLETELGVHLINRSTRKLTLTEPGKAVLVEALLIKESMDRIQMISDRTSSEIAGILRVSCSRVLADLCLVKWVCDFARDNPSLRVELLIDDVLNDLIDQEIDIAIRIANLKDSSMVARKLADNPMVVVAAPEYIVENGAPSNPEDLTRHRCITYHHLGKNFDTWSFSTPTGEIAVKVEGAISLNDGASLVQAAVAGAGIAAVFGFTAVHELARGGLIRVLEGYKLPMGPAIYALSSSRKGLPLSAVTFMEFIKSGFDGLSISSQVFQPPPSNPN